MCRLYDPLNVPLGAIESLVSTPAVTVCCLDQISPWEEREERELSTCRWTAAEKFKMQEIGLELLHVHFHSRCAAIELPLCALQKFGRRRLCADSFYRLFFLVELLNFFGTHGTMVAL